MDVEARVSELSNLLGQQLHPLRVFTEDNGLVDVQFREQGVEAVEFFSFFKIGVILSQTFKCQLVHQVDKLWVWNISLLETSDSNWIGR